MAVIVGARKGMLGKTAMRTAMVLTSVALFAGSPNATDDARDAVDGLLQSGDAIETILAGLDYRASYVRGMAGTFITRHADDTAALQRAELAGRSVLGAERAGSHTVIDGDSLETAAPPRSGRKAAWVSGHRGA